MPPGGTPASCGCSLRGRRRVAIGAGRAAGDAVLAIAGLAGSILPVLVVGHRPFEGEHAAVVVGDNQINGFVRRGGVLRCHLASARGSVSQAHPAGGIQNRSLPAQILD